MDDGLQRNDGIDPSLGLVVRGALPTNRRHRHPADRDRRRQLVPLGDRASLRARILIGKTPWGGNMPRTDKARPDRRAFLLLVRERRATAAQSFRKNLRRRRS